MKITDPDVIKNGEKDLIEAVKDDLDLDAVKEVLKKRISSTSLSSNGGEIIVHKNKIAFRLDFDLNLSGSLMFDRQGNYIPETDEQNFVSEDLDLDDINISQTLEEASPQTSMDDTSDTQVEEEESLDENELEQPLDSLNEELDIGLPEYDLEDELDQESDDLIDDDINDILKESQDFWEQKKDS
ncbi:MAG: hypothetical protein GXP56_16045 [Deltaproteobacteria bacterium]|nr:hypothetical protein [Deltaproteobacteria bacterium]